MTVANESESVRPPTEPSPGALLTRADYGVIFAMLMVTGVVVDLQAVALSPLVGVMTKDMALSTTEVSAVLNALHVGGALAVVLTSRLGDIAGHKKVLVPLAAGGLVGSLFCVFASTAEMLVAGRFLQGLAVATPLVWGLMRPRARVAQIRQAGVAMAVVIAVFTPVSLVAGGFFISWGLGWQSVFWLMAFCYAVMIILAMLTPETPEVARAHVSLDWVGAIGLGIWLTALVLAISLANSMGFGAPLVLVLFAVAAVVFVLWGLQQRAAREPLMSFHGVDPRQALAGFLVITCAQVLASGVYVLLPQLLAAPAASGHGFGLGSRDASLPLFGVLVGALIAPPVVNRVLASHGPRIIMHAGTVLTAAGLIGLVVAHRSLPGVYLSILLFGCGYAVWTSVGWVLVPASSRTDNISLVMGSMTSALKIVGVVFLAIVLIVLDPGAGPASTGTFTGLFTVFAAIAVVMGLVLGLFLAPRMVSDKYAVDADASKK